MAITFRFENNAATTTYDFTGTDAKQLHATRVWTPGGDRVTETWRFVKGGDTQANIRTSIISLEDMLADLDDWMSDVLEEESIWVRFATDGETAKRALIYSYEVQPIEYQDFSMGLTLQQAFFDIAITRDVAWEDVSASSNEITSTKLWLGSQWDFSGSISGGRLPARIQRLRILNGSGNPGNTTISRAWIGCRPKRYGTTFTSLFECEDHTGVGADTTSQTDTNASGSGTNSSRTTFATEEGMAQRVGIPLSDYSETNHLAGYYHAFLRCRVDNADTQVGVRLSTSFWSFDLSIPRNQTATQYLDGETAYRILPMGTIQMPPSGLRTTMQNLGPPMTDFWDKFWFNFEAQRITGTGNFWMDCMVLIPAEHSIYVERLHSDPGTVINIITNEDGTLEVYTLSGNELLFGEVGTISDTGMKPWGYPRDGGVIVVVAENTADTLDVVNCDLDAIDLDDVRKRWLIYHD
jgi:hypothetical protein